jgi:hypothetical protein
VAHHRLRNILQCPRRVTWKPHHKLTYILFLNKVKQAKFQNDRREEDSKTGNKAAQISPLV